MLSVADSREWLWNLLPLAVGVALATLQKLWSSYQSHRGESWPISYGHVLSTKVETQNNVATLKVSYSYRVGSESYGGTFKKAFRDSDEADAWKSALAGKQVSVRYAPGKPSRSLLAESDLQPIIQAFAPAPGSADAPRPMAWWKRSLCQIGLVLAIIGFGLCVVELVSEDMGTPFLSRVAYLVLLLGGVALPVISMYAVLGKGRRTWRAVPPWLKFLGFVVVYFAMFNAVPFFRHHSPQSQRSREARPDLSVQLAGYFSAIELLYARLRSDPQDEDYLQRSLGSGVKIG